MTTGIVWFRFDLRLEDNLALLSAVKDCEKILPVFIFDADKDNPYKPGAAQQWWLAKSLEALNISLKKHGSYLVIRKGNPTTVLKSLLKETGAQRIYANQCYEPYLMERDEKIKKEFAGVDFLLIEGFLLTDPEKIKNKTGGMYKVYTPYWKACRQKIKLRNIYSSPKKINTLAKIKSNKISMPEKKYSKIWAPGEQGAHKKLNEFLSNRLDHYKRDRDIPSAFGTSNLSPHLHFGEISPMQVWSAVEGYVHMHRVNQNSVHTFLSQLGWREFSYYLLYYFPALPEKNWNEKFNGFKWDNKKDDLKKWQQGETGYPIIDAGMRELLATGTMHNRVRMLVASFLIKDLFVDWRQGEAWFWEHLMDADLANNAASWQWVAGSGADAAPYFRIFNPVLQAQKFDSHGEYIARWVPELKNLPVKYLAAPWEASEEILKQAGVVLGKTYPKPIVDHNVVKKYALEQYKKL